MEEGGKREFKVREAGVSDPPVPLHDMGTNTSFQTSKIQWPKTPREFISWPRGFIFTYYNPNRKVEIFKQPFLSDFWGV